MKVKIIGRSPKCDIVIKDPHVSREHLQIIKDEKDNFKIFDLESSTGTYVNGRKVTGEILLNKNDVVKIGNTLLKWKDFFKESYITEKEETLDVNETKSVENNIIQDELILTIQNLAEDGINSKTKQETLKNIAEEHKLDYRTAVLPVFTKKIAEIKKQNIQKKEDYELSNFGKRLAALIIDSIIVIAFLAILNVRLMYAFTYQLSQGDAMLFHYIVSILLYWLYFAIGESSDKQATFGKQILKIKVTTINGKSKISFANATGRYWAKQISSLILMIGWFMPFWTEKNKHYMI